MTIPTIPAGPPVPNRGSTGFSGEVDAWLTWFTEDGAPGVEAVADAVQIVADGVDISGAQYVEDAQLAATAAGGFATAAGEALIAADEAADLAGTRAAAAALSEASALQSAIDAAAATVSLAVPSMPDEPDAQGDMQGSALYDLPAGAEGAMRVVEHLGLFVFRAASTEPADGETCIAPSVGSGRWLLLLPSYDFTQSRFYGYEFPWLLALLAAGDTTAAAATAALTGTVATLQTQVTTINLAQCIHVSASLDFPSIAATTGTQSLTIAAVGAAVGDRVALAAPSALPAGLIVTARVSAADVVTVTAYNNTASAIDPAAMTYGATIFKG